MISYKKFIPGIAWFFLVLILICLPGDDLSKTNDWMDAIFFDKWVHAGLFSMLAFLFMMPYCKSTLTQKNKWHIVIKIAMAVIVWGLTTEFIQKFFIPGRSFDLWDWVADVAGVTAAVFVCWRLYLFLPQKV
ncbi:MAG: VanZ family protein [Ferruginibacter sp.]|nr:VanZ family protein [Ferruginibacter sp.]